MAMTLMVGVKKDRFFLVHMSTKRFNKSNLLDMPIKIGMNPAQSKQVH